MLVMDAAPAEGPRMPRIYINPEIELKGEPILSEQEGCLSVPLGFRADVQRYPCVRVRALNRHGEPVDEELRGFEAIVLQHEADHLDGTLFIDRISHLRRSLYDSKVKKWLRGKS